MIYNKEKSIEFLVMLDVSFVVLLAISSLISGFLSTLVYNFAFIIPVLESYSKHTLPNPLHFLFFLSKNLHSKQSVIFFFRFKFKL